ncbi:hypothetical protein [Bosea sp. 47.2.35]|uniref:hypothetical protein n=1 Tax=Bosea sp. 47.2.35 TaxID=2969304 RepID=UPI00214FE9EA|nr:hypothetical protein [Bosea sp. 47.2.35]MCR4522221.1 hypothetical protein [Bosea sp. 47.2.35]
MIFDDIQPGANLGRMELNLDPQTVADWRRLFPAGAEDEDIRLIPVGFLAVIAMRAYTHACPIRPPGNIHGEQSYEIISLPEIGSRVVTDVLCTDKEVRRDRRWVTFGTMTRAALGHELLFNGVMKVAWSK